MLGVSKISVVQVVKFDILFWKFILWARMKDRGFKHLTFGWFNHNGFLIHAFLIEFFLIIWWRRILLHIGLWNTFALTIYGFLWVIIVRDRLCISSCSLLFLNSFQSHWSMKVVVDWSVVFNLRVMKDDFIRFFIELSMI